METIIRAEWLRRWEGTGEEHVEDAIDDWITRLRGCPATATYGALIEIYRGVIVDEARRRMAQPPPDDEETAR